MNELVDNDGIYPDSRTWNPFVGCRFDCTYCVPTFKRQRHRNGCNPEVFGGVPAYSPDMYDREAVKGGCELCKTYEPHYHPERLITCRIPSMPIVFVCGAGDIYFCDPRYMRKTFEVIRQHRPRIEKTYYFQSKDPRTLAQFIGEYPENTILLTTLETNRDEGYGEVSRALAPSQRFADFLALDYPRKAVTLEPVMDFDLEPFVDWMLRLRDQGSLEYVWFGYNSKPGQVRLPEPDTDKAQSFVDRLVEAGIEVRGKSLRDVVIE